jgi:acyl-CoA thioester hydrolase
MSESARPGPAARGDYAYFQRITTRWMDNDAYGHVNNVVYYAYFDTVVNEYLIAQQVLSIEESAVIGLVVETGCRYFASAAFPQVLEAGLRVAHLGNSSVRYEVAIFREGEASALAQGHFVHVYVDRQSRRPVPLPEKLRAALSAIKI